MNDIQVVGIVLNFLLGLLLLLSYIVFLVHRIYNYGKASEATLRWLWSSFFEWKSFSLWCISAFVATVSYLGIFFWVVYRDETKTWSENMNLFTAFNALFLFFSALYAWLVFRVFKEAGTDPTKTIYSRLLVLFDLFLVALFACLMTWSVGSEYGSGKEFALAVLLTIHCFLVDFLLWGIPWFSQNFDKNIYHDGGQILWFGAALDPNSSESTPSIFSRLRIRTRDYGAV